MAGKLQKFSINRNESMDCGKSGSTRCPDLTPMRWPEHRGSSEDVGDTQRFCRESVRNDKESFQKRNHWWRDVFYMYFDSSQWRVSILWKALLCNCSVWVGAGHWKSRWIVLLLLCCWFGCWHWWCWWLMKTVAADSGNTAEEADFHTNVASCLGHRFLSERQVSNGMRPKLWPVDESGHQSLR